MTGTLRPDLCVIGAGPGGLTVAAGASQMGARVVLVERGPMGGDCLNTGCVPSKALLAAADAAHRARTARQFGIEPLAMAEGEPRIDFGRVHDHVHDVIAAIAPHDSRERFEGLGVQVIPAEARFATPRAVVAGDVTIRARRFVIATGSVPRIPEIPGLDQIPVMTTDTVFDRRVRLDHLVVIGGGPVGVEIAQAHRRLGSRVTLIEQAAILPNDDSELVAVIRDALAAEGVALREGAEVVRVAQDRTGITLTLRQGQVEQTVTASDVLVAAGRVPALDRLGLDEAGIATTPKGIAVDARLRTSNHRVYAIGDAAGGGQFTHLAEHHAGVIIRNALFRWPAKARTDGVPRVTFTDPELAQVGLTEAEARSRQLDTRILRAPFAENDRAQAERRTAGLVKLVVGRGGRILGAGIAGPSAGELIHPWVLAIGQGLKIGAMATAILPYPTLGLAGRRAAGSFYTDRLFSPRTRRLVRFLARFG